MESLGKPQCLVSVRDGNARYLESPRAREKRAQRSRERGRQQPVPPAGGGEAVEATRGRELREKAVNS